MNEKPKSIWKKSRTGWGWLRAWLVVVVATFFIVLIVTLLIPGGARNFSDWWPALGFTLVVSVVGAVSVGLLAFIRCFFCWRNFKRLLFGVACLATLIALVYAEEDWRGWHAWNKFKHEWEAKGEHFDFASVVPPPVPDDQNFALAPIVFTSYGFILNRDGKVIPYKDRDTNFVDRLKMSAAHNNDWPTTNGNGNWQAAKTSDLKVWQNYYRTLAAKTIEFPVAPQPQSPAQDVLLALSKYGSAIEELRQASQLPYSRFPLNYDTGFPGAILLPHLADLKYCAQVLQLRSIAELQNGQSDKALDDVKLALQLTDKIHTEPFLISHLVRIAMVSITLQPIWEGLGQHEWSDAQLKELEIELAKIDFLTDYEFAMRGGRTLNVAGMDYVRRTRDLISFLSQDRPTPKPYYLLQQVLSHLTMPDGFFYQNELTIGRMHQQWTLPMVDVENRTVSPATVHRNQIEADKELQHHWWPYKIFARLLFPGLEKAVRRFANAQSSVDLARVAIVLERYRLAHGEYPESLDALSPQLIARIPHDIINGQPLHYRHEASGQFVLYSVGWNERDDGGVVVFNKGSTPSVDINQGDWVWRYPSK